MTSNVDYPETLRLLRKYQSRPKEPLGQIFTRVAQELEAKTKSMTEDQIKYMVDRFLNWRLPQNFNPDAGISYTRPNYHPNVDATPRGTNLFDATQADAMVRYMVEGLSG